MILLFFFFFLILEVLFFALLSWPETRATTHNPTYQNREKKGPFFLCCLCSSASNPVKKWWAQRKREKRKDQEQQKRRLLNPQKKNMMPVSKERLLRMRTRILPPLSTVKTSLMMMVFNVILTIIMCGIHMWCVFWVLWVLAKWRRICRLMMMMWLSGKFHRFSIAHGFGTKSVFWNLWWW